MQNTGPRWDLGRWGSWPSSSSRAGRRFMATACLGCAPLFSAENRRDRGTFGIGGGPAHSRLEMPRAGAGATRPKRHRIRAGDRPLRLDPCATGARDNRSDNTKSGNRPRRRHDPVALARRGARFARRATGAIAWSHTPTQNAHIEAQGSVHAVRAPLREEPVGPGWARRGVDPGGGRLAHA